MFFHTELMLLSTQYFEVFLRIVDLFLYCAQLAYEIAEVLASFRIYISERSGLVEMSSKMSSISLFLFRVACGQLVC